MVRRVAKLMAIVAFMYVGLCAVLFFYQRNLIYFPPLPNSERDTDTFVLSSDGAQLLVNASNRSGTDAVIYFGGNAEDVSYSLPTISAAFQGYAIYLLHYRGYGGSTGKPSEAALVADAIALFDKVHAEHHNVVVVGRSLGSGVAMHLASQRPVARLVLVTPYSSLQELAESQFPYLPIRWLMLDKFESWKYAERINTPTLVIAAEHDEIIPRASTDALYGRFRNGVASLKTVVGAGHNTISNSPDYIPYLRGVQ